MYIGSYFDVFAACVAFIATRDPEWHQLGSIPAEGLQTLRRLVKLCLPGLHSCKEQLKETLEACDVLNGVQAPGSTRLIHHCRVDDVTKLPCCASLTEVKRKIKGAH